MRAGHAERLHLAGKDAEHLSSLLHLEAVLAEVDELLMRVGHGRGIDHQTLVGVLARMGYLVDVLLVVDEHAFLLQPAGELGGGLVVACHDEATADEVAGDGAHADATGSDEVDCSYILCFHSFRYCFANLMTSWAMMRAESGSAIFRILALSERRASSSVTVSTARRMTTSGASLSLA